MPGGNRLPAVLKPAPPQITLVTQSTDAATPVPDLADAARQLVRDDVSGAIYVYGYGVVEDATAQTVAQTGYVEKLDLAGTSLLWTPRYGKTTADADTRLFNGLIADDGSGTRCLFVSGKTDTDAAVLCGGAPYLKAPDTNPTDASTNGLIFKFDLSTLVLLGALIVQSPGGEFDEIASMQFDPVSGMLIIAGSTRGDIDGTGPPACLIPGGCNDVLVGAVDPSLAIPPVFKRFGTEYFDEDLGACFDPIHGRLFLSGSTKGALCTLPPGACSPVNTHDYFDSYVASVLYAGGVFTLEWVYQFGVNKVGWSDPDVSHELVLFNDVNNLAGQGAGTPFLYETGYTTPGASDPTDFRISRIQLDGSTFAPVLNVAGQVESTVITLGSNSNGDSGASLYLGQNAIWATATIKGGPNHASGGPCGNGINSLHQGHLFGFDHSTFATAVAPTQDFSPGLGFVSPSAERSVTFEGVTYHAGTGTFYAVGATTRHFDAGSTAACGGNANHDWDDETDAVVFSVPIANP